MYVCMYVSIYVCMPAASLPRRLNGIDVCVCVCVCVFVRMHIRMHVRKCMYVYVRVYLCKDGSIVNCIVALKTHNESSHEYQWQ